MSPSIQEHHDKCFAEIPAELCEAAVAWLKLNLSDDTKAWVVRAHAADPVEWWAGTHFGWGMVARNRLRTAGFVDEKFPSGNLDDYYVALVEAAVGLREMPT